MAPRPPDFDAENEGDFQALFDRLSPAETMPAAVMARVLADVATEVSAVRAAEPYKLVQGKNGAVADTLAALGATVAQPAPETAAAAPAVPARNRDTWIGNLFSGSRLAMAGALLGILLIAVIGLRTIFFPPTVATLRVANGSVTILRTAGKQFERISAGQRVAVYEGDRILAGQGSANLELFPQQIAVLSPGSDVELRTLTNEDGETHALLQVLQGQTLQQVNTPLGPEDSFEVQTADLIASVHGTKFFVAVPADGKSLLAVVEGTVAVETGGESLSLDAGEIVSVVEGQPPEVETFEGAPDLGGEGGELVLLAAQPGADLTVYTDADADSTPLGVIEPGRSYAVISQAGDWYQICCVAGSVGWVQAAPATPGSADPNPMAAAQEDGESASPDGTDPPGDGSSADAAPGESDPTNAQAVPAQSSVGNALSATVANVATPMLVSATRVSPPLAIRAPRLPVGQAANTPPGETPEAAAPPFGAPTPIVAATETPPATVPPTALPTATMPPTALPTATAVPTQALPTDTPRPPAEEEDKPRKPTRTPTNTPVPTDTQLAPTNTPAPTDTRVPPTNTPAPTDTRVPPTNTPAPTDTRVPPTNTPAPTDTSCAANEYACAHGYTVPPTDTPVPPTDTPVPPTDTPVPPTDTPVPPTDTPVPPTDTPVPPTDTPVPPTDTPVPPTDTPVPPTDTPVPPTDTPAPPPVTPTPRCRVWIGDECIIYFG